MRAVETIGRPLGPSAFLDRLAALAGRDPRPAAQAAGYRGRKPEAEIVNNAYVTGIPYPGYPEAGGATGALGGETLPLAIITLLR